MKLLKYFTQIKLLTSALLQPIVLRLQMHTDALAYSSAQKLSSLPNYSSESPAINHNFKQALRHIKLTTDQSKELNAAKNAWYLLLGPTDAGKTTLLSQSNLPFFEAEHLVSKTPPGFENLGHSNWWLTANAIIIDTPGRYLTLQQEPAASQVNSHWQSFLQIFKKQRGNNLLRGIIVAISITELANQTKKEQQAFLNNLRQRIQELASYLNNKPYPLYVMFTKMDYLAGFTEFFEDLGKEERAQALGITLQPLKQTINQNIAQTFSNKFESLIKRLNDRLIWRLHHERNAHKRSLIKDFPLQLDSLKNILTQVIYYLGDATNCRNKITLAGVYFNSATQQNQSIDYLGKAIAQNFDFTRTVSSATITTNPQAFFVERFFKDVIFNKTIPSNTKTKWTLPHFKTSPQVLLLLFLVILTSLLFFYHGYQRQKIALKASEKALAQYQLLEKSPADLMQVLATLNSFSDALNDIDKAKVFNFIRFNPQNAINLNESITEYYHHILQQKFMPAIAAILEQKLASTNLAPHELFATLKAYLMLESTTFRDPQYLKNWYINYWQHNTASTSNFLARFSRHLDTALAQAYTTPINNQYVANARKTLRELPTPLLAYLILKNQFEISGNNLLQFNDIDKNISAVFNFTGKNFGIPAIYTAVNFDKIYPQRINEICQTINAGNWVLGEARGNKAKQDSQQLAQQVAKLYATDYINWWQRFLDTIQIKQFTTIQEATQALQLLSSAQSPLSNLLNFFKQNMQFNKLINNHLIADDEDTDNVSGSLQTVDSIIINNKPLLAKINNDLNQLNSYLQKISDGESALTSIKTYLRSNNLNDPFALIVADANAAPEPLKTWLTQLTNNSWKALTNTAKSYLNTKWQETVYTTYNSRLAIRYPLVKTATKDVELKDFTAFFSPNGKIDTYFNHYIKAFINTDQPQWVARKRNNRGIEFSNETLQIFERAAIIRKMFFHPDDAKLYVGFTLVPTAFEPNVKSLQLKIGSQIINDQPDADAQHFIVWPGSEATDGIKLTFTDNDDRTAEITIPGAWALFKLLDKGHLLNGSDTRHFDIIFDANGNSAKYQLIANSVINPFIPGIIEQFTCPKLLLPQ